MPSNRRAFLRRSSALGAASVLGLASGLDAFQARAAGAEGYKALVCVFLLGGMDSHDVVLPYDQASYDRYAGVRAPLLGRYAAQPGGSSRARDRLLPILADADRSDGRQFALTEELAGVKALFDAGDAAIIANVGPLVEPLTREEFEAETRAAPKRLFSHNDQQSIWMSNEPEGALYGWGGRFADAAFRTSAGSDPQFMAVAGTDRGLFLTGDHIAPYLIGLNGALEIDALGFFEGNRHTPSGETDYQKLRAHFEALNFQSDNLLQRDVVSAMNHALKTNEAFNAALRESQTPRTPFPSHALGGQLRAVANTIAARKALGVDRQVFFVAIGDFDTHSDQAANLPRLLRQIDTGVTAFHQAMQELGVGSDVTLFTASDFGRTLAVNGDGTDHGWGGHHFVVGGDVKGGRIYGDIPEYALNHALDAGSGRLIPTLSVQQYAAPLGRWFGLNDEDLAAALPGLSAFAVPPDFI